MLILYRLLVLKIYSTTTVESLLTNKQQRETKDHINAGHALRESQKKTRLFSWFPKTEKLSSTKGIFISQVLGIFFNRS